MACRWSAHRNFRKLVKFCGRVRRNCIARWWKQPKRFASSERAHGRRVRSRARDGVGERERNFRLLPNCRGDSNCRMR